MKKEGIKEKLFGNKNNMDYGMLITILILLCGGIVMVSSASSYYSLNYYKDSNYLLIRQLILATLGIVAMFVISKINYNVYKKWSYLAYGLSILLLIAVLIPGIGVTRNAATRWLGVGTLIFQPSEIVKITLVMATATYLAANYKKLNILKTYFIPALMLGIVIIIMFLQKHMSGTIVMMVAAVSIMFACGIKIKTRYVIGLILVGMIAIGAFIAAEPFRLKRILSFTNPEEDIQDGNWQAAQSLYAIGSGGVFGRGLGQSRQKYLWLPEAQNDFIFSVLGEEFGLVGTVSVLGIFTFFIYRGYKIAISCKDMYGSLLATGITSIFALQILVNIAVVTCTMPVTRNATAIF